MVKHRRRVNTSRASRSGVSTHRECTHRRAANEAPKRRAPGPDRAERFTFTAVGRVGRRATPRLDFGTGFARSGLSYGAMGRVVYRSFYFRSVQPMLYHWRLAKYPVRTSVVERDECTHEYSLFSYRYGVWQEWRKRRACGPTGTSPPCGVPATESPEFERAPRSITLSKPTGKVPPRVLLLQLRPAWRLLLVQEHRKGRRAVPCACPAQQHGSKQGRGRKGQGERGRQVILVGLLPNRPHGYVLRPFVNVMGIQNAHCRAP